MAAVAQLPGLDGLLVNCSSPAAVAAALPVLKAAAPPGVRLGGYANAFKTTTSGGAGRGAVGECAAATRCCRISPIALAASAPPHAAPDWLAGGSRPGPSSAAAAQPLLPPPAEEYDTASGLILPEAYARHAQRWVQLGAGVVGGCCGVGPAHIAAIRRMLDSQTGAAAAAVAAAAAPP